MVRGMVVLQKGCFLSFFSTRGMPSPCIPPQFEHCLYLNLSNMKEKDRFFLLDAPLVPLGLFGEAVSSVVERFQKAKKQVSVFQRYFPRRVQVSGLLGGSSPSCIPAPHICCIRRMWFPTEEALLTRASGFQGQTPLGKSGVSRTARPVDLCQSSASGHQVCCSDDTRGQS